MEMISYMVPNFNSTRLRESNTGEFPISNLDLCIFSRF